MYRCIVCKRRTTKKIRNKKFYEPRCFRHENIEKLNQILDHGQVVFDSLSQVELKLMQSMPGHKIVNGINYISTKKGDRARVLDLASKIGLTCSEEFSKVGLSLEAYTAQKAGLYDYQIEGVNFLSSNEKALLGDDMGTGKALHKGTLVLTPKGYVPANFIQVGDKVIGKNGKKCTVTARYNHSDVDFYKITFDDNLKISVCGEHLWTVGKNRKKPYSRTLSTKEIYKLSQKKYKSNKSWIKTHNIPFCSPIQFRPKKFEIDPYVLGYYLGNGWFSNSLKFAVNINDIDIISRLIKHFSYNVYQMRPKRLDEDVLSKSWILYIYRTKFVKKIIRKLEDYNLKGKLAHQKFIPEKYFRGSVEQRLDLLKGLLDSDGSANNTTISFSSTSYKLAKGVQRLTLSLGGISKIRYEKRKREDGSNLKHDWKVSVRFPFTDSKYAEKEGKIIPFYSSRKRHYLNISTFNAYRTFKNIEYIGKRDGICFTVDSKDSLYVAQNYIVTHNTVQSVRSLDPTGRTVVVCPACVKYNWRDEINKWAPYLTATVINGRKNFRWPHKGEVIIVNYSILPDYLVPQKKNKNDPYWKEYMDIPNQYKKIASETKVVVDECHKVRNSTTKISKKVRGLQCVTKSTWGLTGTPLLNSPLELWTMLFNLGLNFKVFKNFNHFKEIFKARKNKFGGFWYGKPDPIAPELLRKVMLRRVRDDVLPELPKKIYKDMTVSRIPKDLKKDLDEAYGKWGPYLKTNEMPPFEAISGVYKAMAMAQIPSMLEYVELCEEQDVPILVFCYHREPILELQKRKGWGAILGDTPAAKRQEITKEFQDGKLKGVALTIGAGGVGLTLTRAWQVLFVNLDWIPAMNLQAEDRAARIGQKNDHVLIIRMVTDHPLAQHMLKVVSKKMKLVERSIENEIEIENKNTVKKEFVVSEDVVSKALSFESPTKEESIERCQSYIEIFNESHNKNKKLKYKYKEEFEEYLVDALNLVKEHFSENHLYVLSHIENIGLKNKIAQETLFMLLVFYKKMLKSEKKIKKMFKRKRKDVSGDRPAKEET